MAVRKGESWGEPSPLPADAPVFSNDRSLGRWVTDQRRRGLDLPPVGLAGGDLARTLGGGQRVEERPETTSRFPVDVVRATIDGVDHWFVAHLILRRRWLRGPLLLAMNAAFVGEWNTAPRAHPGDGRIDVLATNMAVRQRLMARSRLASGTHLPHPEVEVRRRSEHSWTSERPVPLWIDGERTGSCQHLDLHLERSPLTVHL